MDLKLFFDLTEVDADSSALSFQSSIYVNHHKIPDYDSLNIALIGLNEYRGNKNQNGEPKSADAIREQLYKLKKGYGDYGILDLGNFRNGPTLDDTYLRLKEVCAYLMNKGIIPILFGGTHDLDLGQYYAYEDSGKLISVLNIDSKLNLEGDKAINHHTTKIFKHTPNYLFNYYHLAYQSYLINPQQLELFDRLSFEALRLGTIKEDIKEVEPIIRDADMLTFDIAAIQNAYAPGAIGAGVYGLTGEEACQLMWYSGQNEKLSSVGLYNYDYKQDSENKTAFVISTMIWYFIEGFYHRRNDKNFMSNDYLKYEVHIGGDPDTIRFYKSKLSERWWVEVPNAGTQGLFNRNRMLACSYTDYQTALKGEVPDRWINFYSKT
ncbi:MAG: formimidoylglutamase [Ekhidna sp.]|nr:formimidoylglutamase [Ekhidna sp.]